MAIIAVAGRWFQCGSLMKHYLENQEYNINFLKKVSFILTQELKSFFSNIPQTSEP